MELSDQEGFPVRKVVVCLAVVIGATASFVPFAAAGGDGKTHQQTQSRQGKSRTGQAKPTPVQTSTPIEFMDAPPPDVQDALMDMPAGDPAEIAKLRKQQEEEEERKRLKDNAEWEAKKKKRP